MEKLIIFYQSFYENLLKESIRDDIEILAWIPCDTIPAVTDYIQTHFSLFQTTNLTICLMTSKFQIQAVIRQFLSILGIDSSQILDIYQLYLHKLPIKQYQQIIRSCTAPLDGMIFGISHGQAGILEDLLPGNALNFVPVRRIFILTPKFYLLLLKNHITLSVIQSISFSICLTIPISILTLF